MIDKAPTLATLRTLLLEDKRQLALWQQQFNAYFEHEEPIDYLDEAREIAHYLMELEYELKGLERATALLEDTTKERSQLLPKVQSFHEQVMDFQGFFDTFLHTSKGTTATAV